MSSAVSPAIGALRAAYAAFYARDVDAVLALLHTDVEWPNGTEGGYVHGHAGVREYWTRQRRRCRAVPRKSRRIRVADVENRPSAPTTG